MEETTASSGERVGKWCVAGQPVKARSSEMGVRDDRLRVPGVEDALLETLSLCGAQMLLYEGIHQPHAFLASGSSAAKWHNCGH